MFKPSVITQPSSMRIASVIGTWSRENNRILVSPPSTNKLFSYRTAHKVSVILTEDLPSGKGYRNDIVSVKAGYARNYLVPEKLALYNTTENLKKRGLYVEPSDDSKDGMGAASALTEEQKAADILQKYLKNKILKIWRRVGPNGATSPGMVDAKAVRKKLSKQLKIDLDDSEGLDISTDIVDFAELEDVQTFMTKTEESFKRGGEIRQLGNYVAKISLAGGYTVPLKFTVVKR